MQHFDYNHLTFSKKITILINATKKISRNVLPFQTSMVKHFRKNSWQFSAINCFHKKAPSQMLHVPLNTPLVRISFFWPLSEASTLRCFREKLFWKCSGNSQKNIQDYAHPAINSTMNSTVDFVLPFFQKATIPENTTST